MDDLIRKQTVLNMIDDVQFGNITHRLSQLYEAVRNYPSVDAVEVVRCKDCKWWDKTEDSQFGYCMAAKHGYLSEHWEISIRRTYKGDFYCADAEPRTVCEEEAT